jgi:hypothetical protein
LDTHHDIRDLSTRPEPDDETDYQALDSSGRPKVLGQAEDDDEENKIALDLERHDEQALGGSAESGDELTEDGFKELCREAMEDPRSMDPATLLFEVLVRVRSRAGEADPRGTIPVEYEATSGETYWKEIEDIVRGRLKGEYDVKAILTEVIEQNTEQKER